MKNISHTDISGNEQNFEILQIFPDARKYKTTYTTKYRNRKVWKKPDLQEIKSVIPGVVTSFTVKEGDHVQKGEELMIYEAMKMQNIILAPFDGTVEKILVKEREKLAKGVIMIYLTSDAKFETEGSPVTYKRKGDSYYRHYPNGHSEVNKEVEKYHRRKAVAIEPRKVILLFFRKI